LRAEQDNSLFKYILDENRFIKMGFAHNCISTPFCPFNGPNGLNRIIPKIGHDLPRYIMPISKRLITKTKFFSHQLLDGRTYRPRTGHEQLLAECYENQLDDDYTLQENIEAILASMKDEEEKKIVSMTLSKYHTLSDSKLIYKLYKIDSKLRSLQTKSAHNLVRVLPGGVIDMTSDDEGAGAADDLAASIDDQKLLDMERKKKFLRKVLHEKLRESLASLTQNEIKDKIAQLKTVVHSVEGSFRDHQISSYEEQQRVFFMKVLIAEEIVCELDDDMKCPISYCLMQDPVTTCNGHTYDRNRFFFFYLYSILDHNDLIVVLCPDLFITAIYSIMGHIKKCHSGNRSPTEPLTNMEMDNLVLTPNKKLATEIRAAVLATVADFD